MAYCCSGKFKDSSEKKDYRMLIFGVIAVVLILGGIVAGIISSKGENSENQNGTPKINIESRNFDFGDVSMANGKVSTVFKIKNEGDADIEISNVSTSCMCTTAALEINGRKSPSFGMAGHGQSYPFWSERVGPGETADLEVAFDPNAHGPDAVGPITRTVTIYSNDQNKDGVKTVFTISANVVK